MRTKIFIVALIFFHEGAAMQKVHHEAVDFRLLERLPLELIHEKIIPFLSPPEEAVRRTFASFRRFLLKTRNGQAFLAFMKRLMGNDTGNFILNSLIHHYADCFLPSYEKNGNLHKTSVLDAQVLVALELNVHAVLPWIKERVSKSEKLRCSAEKYLYLAVASVDKDLRINDPVSIALAHYKIVELLLDSGVSANITLCQNTIYWEKFNHGDLLLKAALAKTNRSLKLAELLISRGAHIIDHQQPPRLLPIHWVTEMPLIKSQEKQNFIHFLCTRGTRADVQDSNGNTPLIRAAELEYFPLVMFLLDLPESNACLEWRNSNGKTLEKILKEKSNILAEGSRTHSLCKQALTKLEAKKGTS